ncbi:MAG TPA: response regulator [Clostridia bacterium]|nr:response regulator [Clostridia bacterium]
MEVVPGKSLHVLLVEDSEDDTLLFKHAVTATGLKMTFTTVSDGQQAIHYLQGKPPFADRDLHPFPTMIVTDLKMPGVDGFDLLKWLRAHPHCAVIPIIVLSSSSQEEDVLKAYQLGANAYFSKPLAYKELSDLLLANHLFWSLCKLPTPPQDSRCQ